jgi:5-methyltetrahydrofolate--homocysteine methyltransferase
LPGRNFINQAFLSSAIQTGVDAVIIDPCAPHIIELIRGAEFLAGKDREGRRYISMFTTPTVCKSTLHPLQKAILMGDKNEVTKQLHKLLESNIQPLKIIDEYLIPGIEEAGERYERKEIFLPQLIGASETMKWGISLIIPFLEKKKRRGKKILLATVEGDLHDLGKNLVKVILEANGYEVIDLGKDAKPTYIAEVCKKEKPNIVGLSCLMTTTLPSLESTVRYLKKECPHIKIIVGGASVDEEFANRIDVFYAKDAIKAVKLLKTIEGT